MYGGISCWTILSLRQPLSCYGLIQWCTWGRQRRRMTQVLKRMMVNEQEVVTLGISSPFFLMFSIHCTRCGYGGIGFLVCSTGQTEQAESSVCPEQAESSVWSTFFFTVDFSILFHSLTFIQNLVFPNVICFSSNEFHLHITQYMPRYIISIYYLSS